MLKGDQDYFVNNFLLHILLSIKKELSFSELQGLPPKADDEMQTDLKCKLSKHQKFVSRDDVLMAPGFIINFIFFS